MSEPCPPPPQPTDTQVGQRVHASDVGHDGTWPMPAGAGPCRTWPLEPGCGCLAPGTVRSGDTSSPWEGARSWTPEQKTAVEVATEILWRATAGQFGLCRQIVRPCRSGCPDQQFPTLASRHGQVLDVPCGCGSQNGCGCPDPAEIRLPGPVYWEPLSRPPDWRFPHRPDDRVPDIELDPNAGLSFRYRLVVWIDGKSLLEPGWPIEWEPGQPLPDEWTPARGDYWLYDPNRLVRLDGQPWPACQDLTRPLQARAAYPDEALGTFGVEYWTGRPVPPAGRRAVSILACELWKACNGDSSCRLPEHVQSITREGVQYQMVDMSDFSAGGKTGLPDVDMWLNQVNPHGVRSQPAVFSPDLPGVRSEWQSGWRWDR